jgi:hypothetical protein
MDNGFDRCYDWARAWADANGGQLVQVADPVDVDPERVDERWQEFFEKGLSRCISHYVTLVDGIVYDGTARQFDPEAPELLSYPFEEINSKWCRHWVID